MSNVLIVVPCFNEANRLDLKAFSAFSQQNHRFELLFVNDGSTDQTGAILDQFCQTGEQFHSLQLAQNQGKAEAVRQGMLWGIKASRFSWVGFLDADLATPLQEMKRLHDTLLQDAQFEAAFGARVIRLGANIERHPVRYFFGRLFSRLVSFVFVMPIYDSQCGAKLFTRNAASHIFNVPFVSPWFFDIELLERLRLQFPGEDLRGMVCEVPLREWNERGGSKVKFGNFLKVPFELWRIKRHYLNQKKGYEASAINSNP